MLHFFEQRSFKDKGEKKISSRLFFSTTFVAIVCILLLESHLYFTSAKSNMKENL